MTHIAPHVAPEASVSARGPARQARSLLLERLRRHIAGIEAAPVLAAPAPGRAPAERRSPVPAQAWNLGIPEIDRHLPQAGLAADGVHEIAPAAHGDMPAALGFAAALGVRRLQGVPADDRPVLWCRLAAQAREWGRLYGHGLEALGLARQRLITVVLNKPDALLWTIEEALKSTALAGVIADVGPGVDLTAVRRLMLAAHQGGTPGLLLFPAPPHGGTGGRSRWIVAANPSAAPPFDDKAPGAPAWNLRLVRCRGGRPGQWFVEWSHATHRFALAPAFSDRTADPRAAAAGDAGWPAAGAGRGGGARLAARRL
jgi:protein ImuA